MPDVDSLNVWELIIGTNKTSPRTRVHISPYTLIEGQYKLIAGPPAIFGARACFASANLDFVCRLGFANALLFVFA